MTAIDHVLLHQERLASRSKEDALQAVIAGFAHRLNRMRDEVVQREVTASKIADYFEHLVDELTRQTRLDAKTHLLNFDGFMALVEAVLRADAGDRWCALGMIDIASFKAINDTFGHVAGDRIIARVAHILRREVRDSDVVSSSDLADQFGRASLHGRFGGDEFCFFLPAVARPSIARSVAERFSRAVGQQEWAADVPELAQGAVSIDVGVVCYRMDPANQRRGNIRQIAESLIVRADTQLYDAKRDPSVHVALETVRLEGEQLIACVDDMEPT